MWKLFRNWIKVICMRWSSTRPSFTPSAVALRVVESLSFQTTSLVRVKIHECPPGIQDASPGSRKIQGDKSGISTTTLHLKTEIERLYLGEGHYFHTKKFGKNFQLGLTPSPLPHPDNSEIFEFQNYFKNADPPYQIKFRRFWIWEHINGGRLPQTDI